jgi:Tol biopolymer transport system component
MKSQWFKHIFGVTAIFLMATVQAQTTERVSVDSFGVQGDQRSSSIPGISADGRFVAFVSQADNLVAGDTNGLWDVFVHDRQTGMTERVSVDSHGFEGDGHSFGHPSISADGRFVTFASLAGNLVADDTNGLSDVFVHDRQTGMTERVSVDSHGNEGNGNSIGRPTLSADGRFVSFVTLANNLSTISGPGVFVHDRDTGITEMISVGIDGSAAGGLDATISADGRFVAFLSSASNLVAGDSVNRRNVFVRDRLLGMTERVSKAPDGSQIEPVGSNSCCQQVSISADGRFVAFSPFGDQKLLPEETNQFADVFVYDRLADTTERVGIAASSDSAQVGISFFPSINASGRFVSFLAIDNDGGDENIVFGAFVRDRALGTLERISVDDLIGGDFPGVPAISADGRWVAFSSDADNLVPGDTNNATDVFVRGPLVSLQPVDLLADLVDMVITLNLQAGISNSLDAKLSAVENALDDLNANNNIAAINALEAFIAAVEAQTGNKISETDALLLIAAARQTVALIEFT